MTADTCFAWNGCGKQKTEGARAQAHALALFQQSLRISGWLAAVAGPRLEAGALSWEATGQQQNGQSKGILFLLRTGLGGDGSTPRQNAAARHRIQHVSHLRAAKVLHMLYMLCQMPAYDLPPGQTGNRAVNHALLQIGQLY